MRRYGAVIDFSAAKIEAEKAAPFFTRPGERERREEEGNVLFALILYSFFGSNAVYAALSLSSSLICLPSLTFTNIFLVRERRRKDGITFVRCM